MNNSSDFHQTPNFKGARKVRFRFAAAITCALLSFAFLAMTVFSVMLAFKSPLVHTDGAKPSDIVNMQRGAYIVVNDGETQTITYKICQYGDGTIVKTVSDGAAEKKTTYKTNAADSIFATILFNGYIVPDQNMPSFDNILYEASNGEKGTKAGTITAEATEPNLGFILFASAATLATLLCGLMAIIFALMFLYSSFKSIPRYLLPEGAAAAVATFIVANIFISFRVNFNYSIAEIRPAYVANSVLWIIGAYILFNFTVRIFNAYAKALKNGRIKAFRQSTLVYAIVGFTLVITNEICQINGTDLPSLLGVILAAISVVLAFRIKKMSVALYLKPPSKGYYFKGRHNSKR